MILKKIKTINNKMNKILLWGKKFMNPKNKLIYLKKNYKIKWLIKWLVKFQPNNLLILIKIKKINNLFKIGNILCQIKMMMNSLRPLNNIYNTIVSNNSIKNLKLLNFLLFNNHKSQVITIKYTNY